MMLDIVKQNKSKIKQNKTLVVPLTYFNYPYKCKIFDIGHFVQNVKSAFLIIYYKTKVHVQY